MPAYADIHWETLGEKGVQWPASALTRAPRRIEPVNAPPAPAIGTGSYLLVTGPLLWDGGIWMHKGAPQVVNLIPAPFVALNPADVAASKLIEGNTVTVTSPHGSVTLTLRADASVQRGTAWIPANLPGLPAETLGAGRSESGSIAVRLV